ncbi:MAG: DEAD/DEAH box helicase [Bdellovibrionales bacterium]|nr:DEAD/DEAH box helicase [Bdellovibrionales bacterium]
MTNTLKFTDLSLHPLILKAIEEQGYKTPTPIQAEAIPHLLQGKDLLGCAQTGTGKTAAFSLPLLNKIYSDKKTTERKQTRALILSPTRELAVQIHESFQVYGKYLNLKTAVIFGGVSQGNQVSALSKGVDILIATPGRLLDLIQQKHLQLSKTEFLVLDEADRMLDMGFLPDVKRLLPLLGNRKQTLLLSATMPKDIQKLAETLLKDPVSVKVAPVSSTAELINQSVMYVDKSRKKDLLVHLLQDNTLHRVIIFTRTKHGANRLSDTLMSLKIPSEAIHGNKSQNARQRALENLKNGKNRVLVATDIVARGIDIDDISHVINFELPADSESYVHRIGRTARAGSQGIAISLCDSEERSYLRDIEKLIGKSIPLIKEHPFHSRFVEEAKVLSKGKAKALIEGQGRKPKKKPWFGKKKSNNPRNFSRNKA